MALAVGVLAVTIEVRHTFNGLAGHAALFARLDHATANRVCALLGIRSVHLISPLTLSLRADHATANKTLRPERPELQDRDRPTDPARILLASAARFYIKRNTRRACHAANAFRRTHPATSYLPAAPRLARVRDRGTIRSVTISVPLLCSRFCGNALALTYCRSFTCSWLV